MIKKWIISPLKNKDIVLQLLINRKIKKEQWRSFLEPNFDNDLHNPFLMKGMDEAVKRFVKAIDNNETIGLFGDYDADGIPGTALLYDCLQKLGKNAKIYIPSREQGYGLNTEGIDYFIQEKVTLMITIDLGIRNEKEIEYASQNSIETIVIDHHEPGDKLPEAIILDPKQKNDKYPFKELAATGVVFKFLQGLSKKVPEINTKYLKWSLDFVAISTICDIVPLIDENRIFVKFGLIVLKKTKRIGLIELYKKSAILAENIDTYAIGFQIGPRLNAPGRIDNANESFYLLTTNDPKKANVLAEKLDNINRRRQAELDRVLTEAREKVCREGLDKRKIILVEGKDWPHGIIGLVAGRLMEEFARPVIVCERRPKDLRGSARSIDAYNIIEALDYAKKYLIKYGGHKKAAGLSLEIEHLSNLYDKLQELAESKLKDDDLVPKIKIDAKLNLKNITSDLLKKLQQFEPFGLGNPRPVFTLENIDISEARTVGDLGKHLKININGLDAIGFGLGNFLEEILKRPKVDLVFTIDENNWNDRRKIQLKIIDLKMR
ncbi:MAG: exonuclease RecJ, single-stranded-DNA-specific exonuclease [Candidatus Berkelbacteria bacterium]|nr:exonuclease RecJ, single-stranded-DNA-specific exonuclease [Candidatus Berkelbacteria bacterium]